MVQRFEFRHMGQILHSPSRPVEGTQLPTAYELGRALQLDRDHCLLLASLDEQGGGDKCVGNDAYVFSGMEEIVPERAIPLNRPDVAYRRSDGKTAWLAKFPATGGFIPRGLDIPGSGTGLLVSTCVTFNIDGSSITEESEWCLEFMQVRWDGSAPSVTRREYVTELAGMRVRNVPLSQFLIDGDTFLAPLTTPDGEAVFRFGFCDGEWQCVCHGPALGLAGGWEPSLRKSGGVYWLHTRGRERTCQLYRSHDGLNYVPSCTYPLLSVPQSLNQHLDGALYLATNPIPTPPAFWLRNPLVTIPLQDGHYGEQHMIYDEGGIRVDTGDRIPFVDHAVSSNLFLGGRWRHLLFFRVCDLKERTPYSFQTDLARLIGKPCSRRATSGLYCSELSGVPSAEACPWWLD